MTFNDDTDDRDRCDAGDDEPTKTGEPTEGLPDKPVEPFRLKHRWPSGYWGGPNIFIRTALFSSSKAALCDYPPGYVASLIHTHIKATGPRLNQWDLDVFMSVLDACKDGNALDVTPRELLGSMQRGTSTRDIDMLKASCRRLHDCHIEASIRYKTMPEKRRWSGELFETFECVRAPTSTGGTRERLRISLDPKLSWFIRDDYTWFDIHHRKLLRKHRLAAGLHAMYSTHSTEYSYPLDRLRDLLGVAARSGEFERLLRAALDVLLEHKLVEGWRIAEKQLTVTPKLNQAKIAYLKRNGLPVPTSVLAVAEAPDKPNAGPTTWLQRFIEVAKRIATWARG